MRLVLFLVLPAVLLLALAAFALSSGGQAQAKEVVIEADNFYFCDASFEGGVCETTVDVGDSVKWQMEDGSHTVTQCDASFTTCPPSGGFDSGALNTGEEFEHTFTAAGTSAYRCNFHPAQMLGRITVVAPQAMATATSAATTAAPTQAAASPAVTAARAPVTGGPPSDGGGISWGLVLFLASGLLVAAAAGLAFRAARNR